MMCMQYDYNFFLLLLWWIKIDKKVIGRVSSTLRWIIEIQSSVSLPDERRKWEQSHNFSVKAFKFKIVFSDIFLCTTPFLMKKIYCQKFSFILFFYFHWIYELSGNILKSIQSNKFACLYPCQRTFLLKLSALCYLNNLWYKPRNLKRPTAILAGHVGFKYHRSKKKISKKYAYRPCLEEG